MTGQTTVLVGSGATIDARTVDLDARVDGMKVTSSAQATASGFAGAAVSKTNTNTESKTLVLIEGTTARQTHVNAPEGMDVSATHTNVVAQRNATANWYGLFGAPSREGNNSGSVGNLVDADAGVTVTVAPRPTAATTGVTPPGPLDTFAGFNHLALLGKANNGSVQSLGGDPLAQDQRAIHWDADVVVGSGPAPELVVDASGHVVRATNVTVNGVANPAPGANAVGANGKIEVADIVNDDLGEIVFQARSEISGGTAIGRHFWGTFTFDDGFDAVRITNESNKDLVLKTIDVVNANAQPHVHLDRGGGDVTINFEIDRTIKPSLVDVRNLGTGDIVLRNGKRIENPIGETRLLNAGGDIVADAAGSNTYVVRTASLGDASSASLAADFERETANQRRYQGSIGFADNGAAPDTLTRTDGTSWTAGGFVVGDLVKIEVAGQPARVVRIAGFTGANAQVAVLSTQAAVSTMTATATVSRFHGIEAARSVGSLAQPIRVETINTSSKPSQLFGGTGLDKLFGGTGEDGFLGDDGLMFVSRNGRAEPLYGITANAQATLTLPGPWTGAFVNITGFLKTTVDLTIGHAADTWKNGYADIVYGGQGDDWIHAGAGNDAVSGAEALPEFYNDTRSMTLDPFAYNRDLSVNYWVDPFTGQQKLFYDVNNPLAKIASFILNFDSFDAAGKLIEDGKDWIYGDHGDDVVFGGTGQDRLWGGKGDDYLQLDDNLNTAGGLNNTSDDATFPQTTAGAGDFAYGGDGLDVLIANTGYDRMYDWGGEFNSFLVPFARFGAPTINRSPNPNIQQFLADLSAAGGADASLAEPNGEMGLFTHSDPEWQANHGAPRDPQPSNNPKGTHDSAGSPEDDTQQKPLQIAAGSTPSGHPALHGGGNGGNPNPPPPPGTPAINIVKAVNAADPLHPTAAEDANDPTYPRQLAIGASVVWTYQVYDMGDAPVKLTSIRDDSGTPNNPNDDFTAAAVLRAGTAFNVGDTNLSGLLDPGEVFFFTSASVATVSTAGWNQSFQALVNNTDTTGAGVNPGFVHDPVGTPNSFGDNIFTGGGSKDGNGITNWQWKTQMPQDKDDIADAFAGSMTDSTTGHNFLTAGLDRYAVNGNSTVGFWFFKSPVSVNANGSFSGVHTDGDLLLVVDFTVGGPNPVPALYRWTGTDAAGSLVPINAPAGAAFATVPSTPTTVPWSFVDKRGLTSPQAGEYLQAGVDLTALFGANVPRYISFMAETRSSASTSSTLSDFALGSVNTIGGSYTVKAGQYSNTVTVTGKDVGTNVLVSAIDTNYHFGVTATPIQAAASAPVPTIAQVPSAPPVVQVLKLDAAPIPADVSAAKGSQVAPNIAVVPNAVAPTVLVSVPERPRPVGEATQPAAVGGAAIAPGVPAPWPSAGTQSRDATPVFADAPGSDLKMPQSARCAESVFSTTRVKRAPGKAPHLSKHGFKPRRAFRA
jgi:hypothetical protein